MKRHLAVIAVLAAAPAVAAGEAPEDENDTGGTYGFSVRMRVGQATAPFFAPGLAEARSELSQARSFIIGAHAVLGRFRVGGRLPAAPSTVRQPAGSYADEKSVGNPELFAEAVGHRGSLGSARLTLTARMAVGLPLADHGEPDTLVKSRALAISDAIDGWLNRELYVPGVVPVTASVRVALATEHLRASARLKIPALIRIGSASLPDSARLRPLGLTPSLLLRGGLWPWPRVGVAAGVWAVLSAPAPVELPEGRDQLVQLGVEARLITRISRGFTLFVEAAKPLGGPLDGTASLGIGASYMRR